MNYARTLATVRREVDRELGPIIQTKVWYVNNSSAIAPGSVPGRDADGYGERWDKPFATLDHANNRAFAGETIVAMEGHAETVADATTWVPDTDGIKWRAQGRGSRRPKITFTNASGNIPVSGVGVEIHNFFFDVSGSTDVVKGITVSAADVFLNRIEMIETGNTAQFVDGISCATCARLEVANFRFFGLVGGDATQSAIQVTDTSQFVWWHDFVIVGEFVTGGIETGAVLDVVIERMKIEQRHATQDACAAISTTAKGFMSDCQYRTATNDAAGMDAVTPGGDLQFFDIGIVNFDGEIAAQHPISDLDVTDNTANTNSPFEFSDMST